jgi:hypothetical protein
MTSWFMKNNELGESNDSPQNTNISALDRQLHLSNNRRFGRNTDRNTRNPRQNRNTDRNTRNPRQNRNTDRNTRNPRQNRNTRNPRYTRIPRQNTIKAKFTEDLNSESLFPTLNTSNTPTTSTNNGVWGVKSNDLSSISEEQQESLKQQNLQQNLLKKQKQNELKLEIQQKRKIKKQLATLKEIDKYCKTAKNDFVRERLIEESGIFSEDENEKDENEDDENREYSYKYDLKNNFYDKNNEYWQLDYIPMKNPNKQYQCIYDIDNHGYIFHKWIGLSNDIWCNKTKYDNMTPEDFGNFHPDDENYIDPREDELYYIFGNDINIGYDDYIYKRIPTGFRNNGELLYKKDKIYRAVYPIFGEEKQHGPINLPSEKKLRETGQCKDIEWTVLGPNPKFQK